MLFFSYSQIVESSLTFRLLKVDLESGELVRDAQGFCVPCKPGDSGEVVGVVKETDRLLHFEGYTDKEASHKKILENATYKGDTVFLRSLLNPFFISELCTICIQIFSGDILHWDRLGYMYFLDRCGDTYRWKGENVSTTQVEAVLQPLTTAGFHDATVYGVQVPGHEGRAGMVALSLGEKSNVDDYAMDTEVCCRDTFYLIL
jgi:solute carrier family 27 fatty acid transporter 1/4